MDPERGTASVHPGPVGGFGDVRGVSIHTVMNGAGWPVSIRMASVVVAMRARHTGAETAEHDSQNRYPVHGPDQWFCTQRARRALGRNGSRLYVGVWYPLLSLHWDDPLIRVT